MGRPQFFTIDYSHALARGLVFAGLGNAPGARKYYDSSVMAGHALPRTATYSVNDWRYSNELSRVTTANQAVDDKYFASGFIISPPFMLVIWLKWTSTAEAYTIPFGLNTAAMKIYQNGTMRVDVSTSSSYPLAQSVQSIPSNKWTSCAVAVRTPGNAPLFFINGVETTYSSSFGGSGTATASTSLSVLNNPGNPYIYKYFGEVADPMIYNRILTLYEIQQLANPSNYMLSGLIKPIGNQSNIYDLEGIR